jgi:hypothetical protein
VWRYADWGCENCDSAACFSSSGVRSRTRWASHHEGVAVLREQQILGLDVPVHHTVRVGVLQSLSGLPDDPRRFVHRKLALAGELGPQAFALDEPAKAASVSPRWSCAPIIRTTN